MSLEAPSTPPPMTDTPTAIAARSSWAATPLRRHDLSESLQSTLASKLTVFAVSQREEFLSEIERPDATRNRAGTTISHAIEIEPEAPAPNPAEPAHGSRDTLNRPHDEADPALASRPKGTIRKQAPSNDRSIRPGSRFIRCRP